MGGVGGSGVGLAVLQKIRDGAGRGAAVEDPCTYYPSVRAGEEDAGGEESERAGSTDVSRRGEALCRGAGVGLTQFYCCLGKTTFLLLDPCGFDGAASAPARPLPRPLARPPLPLEPLPLPLPPPLCGWVLAVAPTRVARATPGRGGWLHAPGVKIQYLCCALRLGAKTAGHVLCGTLYVGSAGPE